MIDIVIKTSGNMVIVYDEYGRRVPEYQGSYEEVRNKILRDAPLSAIFVFRKEAWFEHLIVDRKKW